MLGIDDKMKNNINRPNLLGLAQGDPVAHDDAKWVY